MCTFKIIAVSNWELYQRFHGGGNLKEYAEYLAGLAVLEQNGANKGKNTRNKDAAARTDNSMEKNGSIRPDILIVREKNLPEEMYLELFMHLWEKCEYHREQGNNVEIIPHTHLTAAQQTGCSRIHLPFPLLEKYRTAGGLISGGNPITGAAYFPAPLFSGIEKIGVSVHSPKEAKKAEYMGASYLTAGHIFSTDCKKGVPPRGLAFLEEICGSVTIPVYAIGGIHPENLPLIRQTHAAGACMMSEYINIKKIDNTSG